MIKNNFWNKLFHNKEVKTIQTSVATAKNILLFKDVLISIKQASTLQELINLHKEAWSKGFKNKNLNVCSCGYIRSESVEELTLDTLYLGGRWGLFTKPASFWETMKDEPYGCNGFGMNENILIYDLIKEQYKNFLYFNCKEIIELQTSFLEEAKANNYL